LNYDLSEMMLKKAKASLRSAMSDIDKNDSLDRAISSLYYASFQSVVSLMILRGESSSKHKYVRQYVNKTLVIQDKVLPELGRMYNRLMDSRADADYDPTISFTLGEAKLMLDNVVRFVDRLEEIIISEKQSQDMKLF
jgi:uncharacterized protein (UPF0332 family)